MIQYKFNWYKPDSTGLVEVNPTYTSQECSVCHEYFNQLTTGHRVWTCPNCQTTHDRDINAAINILNRWDDGVSLSSRS